MPPLTEHSSPHAPAGLAVAKLGHKIKKKASLPLNDSLARKLASFSAAELKLRQKKLEALALEQGVSFQVPSSGETNDQDWQLDILPFVIPPDEWKLLEAGLIQRMRAFDRFLTDLYSEQRILKEKVIPYELILNDPTFLRQCMGMQNSAQQNRQLLMGAVDLVRTQDGKWLATQQQCSTPFGLSYVIQHRRMLNQAFPELFESMNVQPVFSFSTELVEALSSFTDKPSPHIVLLSKANTTENDFEESFLARRMGIAVVNPVDLIVREGRVFLKTITGLEQVDVIYRRIPTHQLDPIAFGPSGTYGIPGLINCVRKGTVAVANSIGSGIADNKALLRYADQIISYYLGEKALLETVDTYACADPDQRDYVKSQASSMLLKPLHREGQLSRFYDTNQRTEYQKKLTQLFQESPERVVAQPFVDASTVPRYDKGRLVPLPVYLRAFVLLGPNPMVLPGGLTRQALTTDPHYYIADLAGGAKDTWVPALSASRPRKKTHLRMPKIDLGNREFHIASSVAESIYWIGRYTERAENTARMVRIMEECGWKQLGKDQKLSLWPLWQGVTATTGNRTLLKQIEPPRQVHSLGLELVLHGKNPASIPACIHAAYQNAREIREYLTLEVWTILSRLHTKTNQLSEKKKANSAELQDSCLQVTDTIASLNGTLRRTMPNDETLEFYQLGLLIERATATVTMLDTVLSCTLINLEPSKHSDPDLTLLLRLLGSLDSYQREYRSRTHSGQVADLLWRHHQTPSSVAFCAKHLRYGILNILKAGKNPPEKSLPYQSIELLLTHLKEINVLKLFPQTAFDEDILLPVRQAHLDQMLKRVNQQGTKLARHLYKMHEQIEDTFFSHQAGQA
ncbi:MAG: circularly permuted type 2 ATP-grasp protein [Blastochloris sp.]|nr:circularly permuted type 2 ATP-grasp protein [Blastochloris sp.]